MEGELAILRRTLAREAHVIQRDPGCLAAQVRNGIWLDDDNSDDGRELLDRAEVQLLDRTWLRLTNRPMMPNWWRALGWRLPIAPVSWSEDGRGLTHGSALLDPRTGGELGALAAIRRPISFNSASRKGAVVWSPAGDRSAEPEEGGAIVVRSYRGDGTVDGTVRIDTGDEGVWCLAWSPDGRSLASGSSDGRVRVWRPRGPLVECGDVVWSTRKPILCVEWSPNGRRIAAGSWRAEYDVELEFFEGLVHITPTGRGTGVDLPGHTFRVESVAWAPDGSYLASGAADGTIRVWGAEGCIGVLRGTGGPGEITHLAWSPDGRWLATSGAETYIWDIAALSELPSGDGRDRDVVHREGVLSTAWSHDGRMLATGGRQSELFVCDADTGAEIASLGGGMSGDIQRIAWSRDGRIAFVATSPDWELRAWDPAAEEFLGVIDLPISWRPSDPTGSPSEDRNVGALSWSPDGQVLVTSDAGRCWAWTPGSKDLVALDAEQTDGGGSPPSNLGFGWIDPDGVMLTAHGHRIAHAYCVSPPITALIDTDGSLRVAVLSGDGDRPIPFRFELRTPVGAP